MLLLQAGHLGTPDDKKAQETDFTYYILKLRTDLKALVEAFE
jgi:hypothetical protein